QRRAAERLDDRAQLWPEHLRPVPARTADRSAHNLSRACLAALICCRHVPPSVIVPGLILCPTCAPPRRLTAHPSGTGRYETGVELNKIGAIGGNRASCKRIPPASNFFHFISEGLAMAAFHMAAFHMSHMSRGRRLLARHQSSAACIALEQLFKAWWFHKIR